MENLTRRDFVQSSIAASSLLLGAGCGSANKEAGDRPAPIIDCHTHFYDPTRAAGVPSDFPPRGDDILYRPTYPDRFMEAAAPLGVEGTVVVEASIWEQDNQWMLDLAKDEPAIVGVVGNLVPGNDGFKDQVKRLSRNQLFRGIRLRGPDHVTLAVGLASRSWVRDMRLLADHDLSVDVATWSGEIPHMVNLARRIPALRVVINHIAGVQVDGGPPSARFVEHLKRAADEPNIYCKISGLVEHTTQNTVPTEPAFYAPTIDAFWNTFGGDRLIYGSNWPVCLRAAPYATVFHIVDHYFSEKGMVARDKFFSHNAARAYKWVRQNNG